LHGRRRDRRAGQQAVVESRRWVPSAAQLAAIPGGWAGDDPPAVYFRATQAQMESALAKWWRA